MGLKWVFHSGNTVHADQHKSDSSGEMRCYLLPKLLYNWTSRFKSQILYHTQWTRTPPPFVFYLVNSTEKPPIVFPSKKRWVLCEHKTDIKMHVLWMHWMNTISWHSWSRTQYVVSPGMHYDNLDNFTSAKESCFKLRASNAQGIYMLTTTGVLEV